MRSLGRTKQATATNFKGTKSNRWRRMSKRREKKKSNLKRTRIEETMVTTDKLEGILE